ncbi:hypothetical protein [Paracoccus sp. (in: a-proteobacteria)]|uniref:hypothetical protein n=1 Tax=Paracoccus sp. TaxID=267 RepID=UPI00272A60F1|nr:hypothetical protein [Paracoccus sp. (in: a-proteobacteria)]
MTLASEQLDQIEGRLMAHRRLLAQMLAAMPDTQRRQMLDWLDARSVMRDGQEDPGAVPTDGMAEAMAVADEYRAIADLVAPLPDAARP